MVRLVDGQQLRAVGVLQNPVILSKAQAKFLGHLFITGLASRAGFHRCDRFRHLPRLAMYGTGGPVASPDFVQHGAADADAGVGLEAGALIIAEILHRLNQPDESGLNQILHHHAVRQASFQMPGNAFDQRQIAFHIPDLIPGAGNGGVGLYAAIHA